MCDDWFWPVNLVLHGVALDVIGTLVIQLIARHLMWV